MIIQVIPLLSNLCLVMLLSSVVLSIHVFVLCRLLGEECWFIFSMYEKTELWLKTERPEHLKVSLWPIWSFTLRDKKPVCVHSQIKSGQKLAPDPLYVTVLWGVSFLSFLRTICFCKQLHNMLAKQCQTLCSKWSKYFYNKYILNSSHSSHHMLWDAITVLEKR